MSGYAKTPDDVLDYDHDWERELALSGGDTIATSTWSVVAGDCTVASSSATTTTTTAWVAGGTVGVTALIDNRITTTNGRTLRARLTIRILASVR